MQNKELSLPTFLQTILSIKREISKKEVEASGLYSRLQSSLSHTSLLQQKVLLLSLLKEDNALNIYFSDEDLVQIDNNEVLRKEVYSTSHSDKFNMLMRGKREVHVQAREIEQAEYAEPTFSVPSLSEAEAEGEAAPGPSQNNEQEMELTVEDRGEDSNVQETTLEGEGREGAREDQSRKVQVHRRLRRFSERNPESLMEEDKGESEETGNSKEAEAENEDEEYEDDQALQIRQRVRKIARKITEMEMEEEKKRIKRKITEVENEDGDLVENNNKRPRGANWNCEMGMTDGANSSATSSPVGAASNSKTPSPREEEDLAVKFTRDFLYLCAPVIPPCDLVKLATMNSCIRQNLLFECNSHCTFKLPESNCTYCPQSVICDGRDLRQLPLYVRKLTIKRVYQRTFDTLPYALPNGSSLEALDLSCVFDRMLPLNELNLPLTLTQLFLPKNTCSCDALFSCLERLPCLANLYLPCNHLPFDNALLPSLKVLQFSGACDEIPHFPSIETLQLDGCNNENTAGYNSALPTDRLLNVKHLQLPFSYNLDVPLPPHITTLKLLDRFNQRLDNLPSSLERLSLGSSFNKPIDLLPENLKILILGFKFNQHVDHLPPRLERLKFGRNFDQKVEHLPLALKSICFGSKFDQSIDHLPDSVEKIEFAFEASFSSSKVTRLPKNLSWIILGKRLGWILPPGEYSVSFACEK